MITHLSLSELERTLVPANLEKLHEALLVRRRTHHVPNQRADVLHTLAEAALALSGARRELALGDDVTLVEADGDSFLSTHFPRF